MINQVLINEEYTDKIYNIIYFIVELWKEIGLSL